MRRQIRVYPRSAFAILGLFVFTGLGRAQSSALFKDMFEQTLRESPEFATGAGRHEYDDRWTDWSRAARDQRRQSMEARLVQVNTPQPGDTPQDLLTRRVLGYDLQSRLDAWDLDSHLLQVGQLNGFHNAVYDTIDRMPARNVHDCENIIARLRAVPVYVDQNLIVLDEAIASGMMQSRVVANLVIQQIEAQMKQDADRTELLKGFRNFPASIPAAEQQRLRREAQDAYNQQFLPAWRKLYAYMSGTYLKNVRAGDSLSSMKGGRAAYAILIRRLTTTKLSGEEIHSLGEHEVTRIEGEMTAIVRSTGFPGSIAEFQKKLDADPAMHFHSKDEMLANSRNIAKIIEPNLPNQFRHIPSLLFGIRPISPDREAASATNAQGAAPDLSAPGWFNLNTYLPEKQVRYDQESLVLHEAIPGHIFQGAVATQQSGIPEIRRFYSNSAFGEGWALYAESLGAELGLYKDPASRFGQLASENFRAVRLVVDTGIHELGWSREQAIDYFKLHSPQASLAEVDRYISWPAQALSYKMGELRIRSLRAKAEQQLGAKFDVRDFNDAVIGAGRLPLDLLSEQIDGFIARGGR